MTVMEYPNISAHYVHYLPSNTLDVYILQLCNLLIVTLNYCTYIVCINHPQTPQISPHITTIQFIDIYTRCLLGQFKYEDCRIPKIFLHILCVIYRQIQTISMDIYIRWLLAYCMLYIPSSTQISIL